MARFGRTLTATVATAAAAVALGAAPANAETAPIWKKPLVVAENGAFAAVGASSWGNIWAAGNVQGSTQPLAARWNGSAWSKVALPAGTREVDAVTASTVHNTWLLDTKSGTHLRKWDDGTWSTPGAGYGKGVTTIAATSTAVLWAGGTGFIRHYNGSAWQQRTLAKDVTIDRIVAHGSADVWAVGHRDLGPNGDYEIRQRPYAMHWNGSTWTTTTVPSYPANGGDGDLESLTGVAFAGTNDVYATGIAQYTDEDIRPIVVHWNGKAWSKVSTPLAGGGVLGVAPANAGGLWALRTEYALPTTAQYRSTSGTWSTPAMSGTNAEPSGLLRVPGTTRTIAVGTAGGDGVIWLDA
ncbi:MAG TPA: hypothetical protein VGL93_34285 [Streptosporangiaceae bacterium]|jgi:hypothetical protein